MPVWFTLYIFWSVVTIAALFITDRGTPDNLTHLGILVYLPLSVSLGAQFSANMFTRQHPKLAFIILGVLSASVVEGCYMFSSPVLQSLLITAGMTIGHMVKNYLIDLALTVPAYFVIFGVIHYLISKYTYTVWEYSIVFGLAQALGDGGRGFLSNPVLLVFLPFIMLNYHAMNIGPYLLVEKTLAPRRPASLLGCFRAIGPIVSTYLLCAAIVHGVAKSLLL
jgi:hypothetical protein